MKNYLSLREAAEKWGVSDRRINQYCAEGRIPGAQKIGKAWAIPAGAEKPGSVSKGLIKLRGELVRLYTMQQELESAAVTDDEKQITRELLADIEKISRDAHDAAGFTYIPLEQLAALQ